MVQEIWNQIPCQFPFVELDEFVVMPDHIHGILIMNESPNPVGTRLTCPDQFGIACPQGQDPEKQTGGFAGHQNPMFHLNLSRIIRWFKGRCSFEIRKSNPSFEWQSNYYEHIIRNTEAYERICEYIRDNPKNHKSK